MAPSRRIRLRRSAAGLSEILFWPHTAAACNSGGHALGKWCRALGMLCHVGLGRPGDFKSVENSVIRIVFHWPAGHPRIPSEARALSLFVEHFALRNVAGFQD